MLSKKQLFFWVGVWLFLILLFSTSLNGYLIATYFVTILLPVIIATSIFFNRFLVPRYLLTERKKLFFLYLTYMLIVSIYLELLVMLLAFVILADYQFDNLGKIAGDIYLLTIILYLVVLVEGLMLAYQKLKEHSLKISTIEQKLENEEKTEITIRSDRKNILIKLNDILLIESLGDYVKIHLLENTYTTKERISNLESRLPKSFIRTHRSFIVNKDQIEFYNKEYFQVLGTKYPIGRKYKNAIEIQLANNAIS